MQRFVTYLLQVSLGASLLPPDHILIVSRHGVRRQFPSSAFKFEEYAPGRSFETSNEEWGAGKPGMDVLTQHGYDAVLKLGEAARRRYMPDVGESSKNQDSTSPLCSSVAIYCEEGMARDEKTAEAFFKGLGCESTPPFIYDDAEYIIDQGSIPRGDHGECALLGEAETQGRVGGDLGANYASLFPYKSLLDKLSNLLGCCSASLCEREGSEALKLSSRQQLEQQPASGGSSSSDGGGEHEGAHCSLRDLRSHWDDGLWYATFEGPLYAGKYFGEWFLLNYLNGMDFAWGELSAEEVLELGAFVTLYRSFEFDLPAARSFGSALLTHVAATLHLWSRPSSPAPPPASASATASASSQEKNTAAEEEDRLAKSALAHGPKARVVYYAAHDTNLLYLAELLGLKWLSRGGWQPNHTSPGGQLVFEVYGPTHPANTQAATTGKPDSGSSSSGWTVALFFDTQTPQQMRDLTDLSFQDEASTPSRSAVTIPGCSSGPLLLCPVDTLVGLVRRAVVPNCVTPPKLRAFAEGPPPPSPLLDANLPNAPLAHGGGEAVVRDHAPAAALAGAAAAAPSSSSSLTSVKAKPAALPAPPDFNPRAGAEDHRPKTSSASPLSILGTVLVVFVAGAAAASVSLNLYLFRQQRRLGQGHWFSASDNEGVRYDHVLQEDDASLGDDEDLNDHEERGW